MKVPMYSEQVDRTRETPGRQMTVQASPQQFSKAADAAQQFYAQAQQASFQFAQIEAKQKNEGERLTALNESNRMLVESSTAAEQMAMNDPDSADQYMEDSINFYRDKFSQGISNETTRQQFLLQYDAQALKSQSAIRTATRDSRAKKTTAAWATRKIDLANQAASGDQGAARELFGDAELGIKSHFDIGVETGAITPGKAVTQADSTRTMVAKNRLIGHMDSLQTAEKLQQFSDALETGELPPELSADLALLLPSEIKTLKRAVQTEITSDKALQQAADALLSDEKRLQNEQFFNDPEIPLEQKKEKLLSIAMSTPASLGLTSSDFRASITHGRARTNAMLSAVKSANTSIGKRQNEIDSILSDGFDPGVDVILALDSEIASLGSEASQAVLQKQFELKQTYGTVNEMRAMGPVELERYISDLEQQSRGEVDSATAAIVKNGRTMLSKLSTRIADGDALGAAQDRGIIEMPALIPSLYTQDQEGNQVTNEEFFKAVAQRKEYASLVAQRFGLQTTQYLTKTEAQTYKSMLKEGSYVQRLSMLEALTKGFGAEAPAVLNQISNGKDVGVYGHIGGLLADGRNEAAEDALKGMDILERGGPIQGLTPSFTDMIFSQTTGSAFDGLVNARGSLEEAAKAIYAKRYGTTSYNPSNFAEAIQAAAGRTADGRGGISEVHGVNTIVPDNMNADDMENLVNGITVELLQNPEISGQVVSRKIANNIRSNQGSYKAHPAPGTGMYYLYRGEISTPSYQWVKDVNGDPILIDFKKMHELTAR